MARPKKKGFEYFRLDTDFFYNKKIKALRRAHGPIGVLTYVNILCKVYEKGYYLEVNDINDFVYNISEEISKDKIGRTAARVHETINYLVDNNMLDRRLFEKNVISGYALQRQYVVMAYRARRKIEMDVYKLVDVLEVIREIQVSAEETVVIAEETNVNAEDGTQSKVNSKYNSTTFILNAHTREREKNVEKSVEKIPPTFDDVLDFMLESTDVSAERVYDEAGFFISYNKARGWDCLPNWQEKALAWAKQIKIINGG